MTILACFYTDLIVQYKIRTRVMIYINHNLALWAYKYIALRIISMNHFYGTNLKFIEIVTQCVVGTKCLPYITCQNVLSFDILVKLLSLEEIIKHNMQIVSI